MKWALVLAVASLAAATSRAQSPFDVLTTPIALDAGNDFVLDVALADLDGDGRLDVAVTTTDLPGVSVMLSADMGGFEPAQVYPVGASPRSIVAADLSDDGVPDLATADFNDTVSVLINLGKGVFAPAVIHAGVDRPLSIAAGDVDGSGTMDLVVTDYDGSAASVLPGLSGGAFGAPYDIPLPTNFGPMVVELGDLDGDGILDLVAGECCSVAVLLGLGGGAFGPPAVHEVGHGIERCLAIGDVDADGWLDVVTPNAHFDDVSVLRGLGGGVLAEQDIYPVEDEPLGVAIGDLDGDGVGDVAVANSESWSVSILLGRRDGTLAPAVSYPTGEFHPDGLALGDVSGDGWLDVATAMVHSQSACLMQGLGDGTLAVAQKHDFGSAESAVVADLDGDGHADIALVQPWDDAVVVVPGHSDGTWNPSTTYSGVGASVNSIAAGDVTGDGLTDLLLADSERKQLSLLPAGVSGSLLSPVAIDARMTTRCLELGDLDGDDRLDAVVGSAFVSAQPARVGVLLSTAQGVLQLVTHYPLPGTLVVDLAIADATGDGLPDVLAVSSGDVQLLPNLGGGALGAATSFEACGSVKSLAVGDFDRDGWLDLAGLVSASTELCVALGIGGGAFGVPAYHGGLGEAPTRIYSLDLDGDGRLDLVTAHDAYDEASISTLYGLDGGLFGTPARCVVMYNPEALAPGDLDGDGRPDLVAMGTGDTVALVMNRSAMPWTDLGGALAGVAGPPKLAGTGWLLPGSAGALALSSAAPLSLAMLFASAASSPVPFHCGELVPMPAIAMVTLGSSPAGAATVSWPAWPAGLSGSSLYFQFAIADPAAPCGASLSNAVRADVP